MVYSPSHIDFAVQSLCPGLVNGADYVLSDHNDGNGPVISVWNTTKYPQPTVAQLEAVDTEAIVADLASFLPQDLFAQFTPADMVKITAAVAADTSGQTALLWYSLTAQRDRMVVGNARVRQGWAILVQVLGADRMNAIAAELGVTVAAP